MSTNVKVFWSTDTGAPAAIAQTAGQMLAILDGVLVDGYNSKTITITRDGSTATASCTAHGFRDGACLLVAGADQADYNGEHYITRTAADAFTFPVANSPVTPATGTITAKVAPAGWTKAYSGTNKAAYRQGGGNQMYLRVDDTTSSPSGPGYGRLAGYEAMTDVDTGSGKFPTQVQVADGLHFYRSNSATGRLWIVVATDRHLYLFVNSQGTSNGTGDVAWFFGDLKSRQAVDPYATMLIAPNDTNSTHYALAQQEAIRSGTGHNGHYLARSYTGLGSAIKAGKFGDMSFHSGASGYLGLYGAAFPNPTDGSLLMSPVTVFEPTSYVVRGSLPGVWAPLHNLALTPFDTVSGTGDLAGKSFLCLAAAYSATTSGGQVLLETSNTWDL